MNTLRYLYKIGKNPNYPSVFNLCPGRQCHGRSRCWDEITDDNGVEVTLQARGGGGGYHEVGDPQRRRWDMPPLPALWLDAPPAAPSTKSTRHPRLHNHHSLLVACPEPPPLPLTRAQDLPLLHSWCELEFGHRLLPPLSSTRGAWVQAPPPPLTTTFTDGRMGHHAAPHLPHHLFLCESLYHRLLHRWWLTRLSTISDRCRRRHLLHPNHRLHHGPLGHCQLCPLDLPSWLGRASPFLPCCWEMAPPHRSLARGVQ